MLNEPRGVQEDRITRAGNSNFTAADQPVVSIASQLQALRDTQTKTLATLEEAHDTLVGPGPQNENKRPQSTYLSDMCLENNDLAEAILASSRRLLKLLGERKG